MKITKEQFRLQRRKRVRARVKGTKERPRLSVFRSLRSMHAQLVDDDTGMVLLALNSKAILGGATKTDVAQSLGSELAKEALANGIEAVVFDRGGYSYHGRVKALAEAARAGGLKF